MCFLRWISPLFPEPFGGCPCCRIIMCGEPERREEGRIDGWREERGVGIFLWVREVGMLFWTCRREGVVEDGKDKGCRT